MSTGRGARRVASTAAAAVLCGLVAGACTQPAPGPGPDVCAEDPGTSSAGEPGGADIALTIEGAPDLLVVYADGAVATLLPQDQLGGDGGRSVGGRAAAPRLAPGYPGEQPGTFVGGALSDCWLAALVETAGDVLGTEPDVGVPQVTDSLDTRFTWAPTDGGAPVSVSAYAFDRDDPGGGGLSGEQARAREELAALWELVEARTVGGDPLQAQALEVLRYGVVADDEVDWPLPPPSELLGDADCAEVTGEPVRPLLDRMADGDLLETEPWRLAVRTLPPGYPACPA